MTIDFKTTQTLIDMLFQQPTAVPVPTSLERIVELTKLGARDPHLLEAGDVQLICDTLLTQYAQMGIGG